MVFCSSLAIGFLSDSQCSIFRTTALGGRRRMFQKTYPEPGGLLKRPAVHCAQLSGASRSLVATFTQTGLCTLQPTHGTDVLVVSWYRRCQMLWQSEGPLIRPKHCALLSLPVIQHEHIQLLRKSHHVLYLSFLLLIPDLEMQWRLYPLNIGFYLFGSH